jgi:hypothetical protein
VTPLDLGSIFVCGIGVGIIGSLLGIGGGPIMVPFLHLIFNVPFRTAIGVSLLSIIATSSGAASVYAKQGKVAVRLGIVLELATVTGGIVGGIVAGRLPESALSFLFALLLIFTAWTMIRGSGDHEPSLTNLEPISTDDRADDIQIRRVGVGIGGSAVAGVSAGLLGIGGGLIKVPLMHEVMGVPFKIATATSTFTMGVTATATALIYYSRGEIDLLVASPMILGVLLGARLGATSARRIASRHLKIAFAVVLFYLALNLLLRSFGITLIRWR